MKCTLLCIVILILMEGQGYSRGAGSSAATTLLQPASARISALSEACTALDGSIDLLGCNPAGIYSLKGFNASLLYKSGIADDNFANIYVGKPFRFGTIGTSLYYYDTGKIELFDASGNLHSKIGKRDLIASLGWAYGPGKTSAGINLKGISSEIFGVKASALALDAGAQYRVTNDIKTGVSIRNLGTGLKFVTKKEKLPWSVNAGVGYGKNIKKFSPMLLTDYSYYPNEKTSLLRIGTELGYAKFCAIRAGYLVDMDESENNALNLGLGFRIKHSQIDYAVELSDDLDVPHKISLVFKF